MRRKGNKNALLDSGNSNLKNAVGIVITSEDQNHKESVILEKSFEVCKRISSWTLKDPPNSVSGDMIFFNLKLKLMGVLSRLQLLPSQQ